MSKKYEPPRGNDLETETSYDMLETLEEELAPGLAMPGIPTILRGYDPGEFDHLEGWLGYVSKAARGLEGFDSEDRETLQYLRLEVLHRLGEIMFATRLSYEEVAVALNCTDPNPDSWRDVARLRRSNNAIKTISETVLEASADREGEPHAHSARSGLELGVLALRLTRGSTVGASRAIMSTDAMEHLRKGDKESAKTQVSGFAEARLRRADYIFDVVLSADVDGSSSETHITE